MDMELLNLYVAPILIGIFVLINTCSFGVMALDKRKAVRKDTANRTPEGVMFFMASILGATGIFVAMLTLRHKTRKWYFQLGIPLLILQNIATVYFVIGLLAEG